MKRANALSILFAVAILAAAPAAIALAGSVDVGPAPTFAGHAYYDLTTGNVTWEYGPGDRPNLPLAAVDIYKNTGNAGLGGIASTDFSSIWGDQVTTTGTGTLDENDLTVFNAAGGNLLTFSVNAQFIDGGSNTSLGGYTSSVINLGSGMPAGNYVIVTFTGLAAASINLSTTNIIELQQINSQTGTSTKLGVVVMQPLPTVGTGSAAIYINSSTIGPAGFYTINGVPQADLGYRMAILQPVPAHTQTWGSIKGQYR